jgi:hypothetical protein
MAVQEREAVRAPLKRAETDARLEKPQGQPLKYTETQFQAVLTGMVVRKGRLTLTFDCGGDDMQRARALWDAWGETLLMGIWRMGVEMEPLE